MRPKRNILRDLKRNPKKIKPVRISLRLWVVGFEVIEGELMAHCAGKEGNEVKIVGSKKASTLEYIHLIEIDRQL